MKGVHRNSRISKGRRVEYGCYRLQVMTRFDECKRLQLTTSVFPDTKNAANILSGMKKMLKEMSREGDRDRLVGMKNGSLKLIDVYNHWLSGRERLLVGNEGNNLFEELKRYQNSGVHSNATNIRASATLAAWKKYSLLDDTSLVRELPAIVQRAQSFYKARKQHDMFNNARMYFLGFIKTQLQHSVDSPLYVAVKKIEQLRVTKRKDHNPFSTPRDLREVIQTIEGYQYLTDERKRLYIDCIMSMCFHPFRPSEFLELKWERDRSTGHLKILGTKTAQSNRIAPLLFYPAKYHSGQNGIGDYRLSHISLNRQLQRLGLSVRTRDFRRTYSVWCEKAGIERSHLMRYLGHAGKTTTDIYQRRAITREELDADATKLRSWIDQEVNKEQGVSKKNWAPRANSQILNIKTLLQ